MGKFQKGQSGNPAGRPAGSVNKSTQLKELLEPHAEALVEKAVNMALDGDIAALKLCMERLIPPVKAQETLAVTQAQQMEYIFSWQDENEAIEQLTDEQLVQIHGIMNE